MERTIVELLFAVNNFIIDNKLTIFKKEPIRLKYIVYKHKLLKQSSIARRAMDPDSAYRLINAREKAKNAARKLRSEPPPKEADISPVFVPIHADSDTAEEPIREALLNKQPSKRDTLLNKWASKRAKLLNKQPTKWCVVTVVIIIAAVLALMLALINVIFTLTHSTVKDIEILRAQLNYSNQDIQALQLQLNNSDQEIHALQFKLINSNQETQLLKMLIDSARESLNQTRNTSSFGIKDLQQQINGQTTNLSRDIEALRRTTATNTEALRTQTTTDIDSLREETTSNIAVLRRETTTDIQELRRATTTDIEALRRRTTTDIENLQEQTTSITNDVEDQSEEITSLNGAIEDLQGNTNLNQDAIHEQAKKLRMIDSGNNLKLIGTFLNPAQSCGDIHQDSPSGEYWIAPSTVSSPIRVYCSTNRTICSCDSTGSWTRIAHLDMTDTSQQCPTGFRRNTRTTAPLRTCGRQGPNSGCVSVKYPIPIPGIRYSRVCGKIKAYQYASPDAFHSYNAAKTTTTINSTYVDGVSLTHGSTRQHIWTFANALDEVNSVTYCPCIDRNSLNQADVVPPFVGNDYFCDTGSRAQFQLGRFYSEDPLWDGQGCGGVSTCCSFNNPPWFCKLLPQSTTDYIELRICGNQDTADEDTRLEMVEIYIQ